LALVLLCVASAVVVQALHERWSPGSTAREGGLPLALPAAPAPRLQDQPGLELELWRNSERQRAASYGWVDRAGGRVHVPLEVALERVLARGFPVRPAGGKR
jgi:hypothetical protein